MAKKDLYEVLGVDEKATSDDLKRARRRKARQTHPDKPGGDHDEMAEINHAFDVLSNPQRRMLYDQTGEDAGPARNADAEMRQVLLQAFTMALDEDAPMVLIRARQLLRSRRDEIKKATSEAKSKAETLKARREKIIVTEGENVFHMIIDQRLSMLAGAVAGNERIIAVFDAALEALKGYTSTEEVTLDLGMFNSFHITFKPGL